MPMKYIKAFKSVQVLNIPRFGSKTVSLTVKRELMFQEAISSFHYVMSMLLTSVVFNQLMTCF